jgi:hypothetical protein
LLFDTPADFLAGLLTGMPDGTCVDRTGTTALDVDGHWRRRVGLPAGVKDIGASSFLSAPWALRPSLGTRPKRFCIRALGFFAQNRAYELPLPACFA